MRNCLLVITPMVLCISFFTNGNEVAALTSGANGVAIEPNKSVWLSTKSRTNLGLSGFLPYLPRATAIISPILTPEGQAVSQRLQLVHSLSASS
ncbi:Uncharacterised protein [Vibrio cholerae]|nr:Uncharacterised protein [Vibrio cholerae]